jgi:hypothetical protein
MTLIAVAALAVPVSASAAVSPADYKNASKFCKALRADMGPTLFKQAFGTDKNRSNAHGKCVSRQAKIADEDHSDAVKVCRAERQANEAAFRDRYGTNKNGSNAFGKCVSQKEDEAEAEHQDAIVSASKQCRTERASNPEEFRDHYGTNRHKRNAFGKCVSKHAREIEQQND